MNIFIGIQKDWRPVSKFDNWMEFRGSFNADAVMVRTPFGWWSDDPNFNLRFNTHLKNPWTEFTPISSDVDWHFVGSPAVNVSKHSIPVIVMSLWEIGVRNIVCEALQHTGWNENWQILDAVRRDFGMGLIAEGIPQTTDNVPDDVPLFLDVIRACRWTFRTDKNERPYGEVPNKVNVLIKRNSLKQSGHPSIKASFREEFITEIDLYDACRQRGWTPWMSVTDEGVE